MACMGIQLLEKQNEQIKPLCSLQTPSAAAENVCCATESNNQKLPHEMLIKRVVEADKRQAATQVSLGFSM